MKAPTRLVGVGENRLLVELDAEIADIGREPTLKCCSRSELALKTGHREAMSYTTWHGSLYRHS